MELSSHFITNRKRLQIPLTGAQQGTLRWTAMSQGFKETFRASCTQVTYQEKAVLMVVAVKVSSCYSFLSHHCAEIFNLATFSESGTNTIPVSLIRKDQGLAQDQHSLEDPRLR